MGGSRRLQQDMIPPPLTLRTQELLRRSGKDPVVLDKRTSAEILNDEIPYLRWAKEQLVLVRSGHRNWVELLKARFDAKNQ